MNATVQLLRQCGAQVCGGACLIELTFLENIRIVHGYVAVFRNKVDRIPLTSLRVIVGDNLYRNHNSMKNYSLYVTRNDYLRQIDLYSFSGMLATDDVIKGELTLSFTYSLYVVQYQYITCVPVLDWKDTLCKRNQLKINMKSCGDAGKILS